MQTKRKFDKGREVYDTGSMPLGGVVLSNDVLFSIDSKGGEVWSKKSPFAIDAEGADKFCWEGSLFWRGVMVLSSMTKGDIVD